MIRSEKEIVEIKGLDMIVRAEFIGIVIGYKKTIMEHGLSESEADEKIRDLVKIGLEIKEEDAVEKSTDVAKELHDLIDVLFGVKKS